MDWLVGLEAGSPGSFRPGRVKGARREDGQLWRLLSLSKTTVDWPERPNWAEAGHAQWFPLTRHFLEAAVHQKISREEDDDARKGEEEKMEGGKRAERGGGGEGCQKRTK